MKILPINRTTFSGKLVQNAMLEEFKLSLNEGEADIFKKQIERMEKENDGREFIFNKCAPGSSCDIAIFEKKIINGKEYHLPMWAGMNEHSKWMFDQLDKMYRMIRICKLVD